MLDPSDAFPGNLQATRPADGDRRSQSDAMQTLLTQGSIELTTNGREAIERAERHLPPCTRVYVPKMPRESLEDKLVQIALLSELGLQPVPHLVARQIRSDAQLRGFLRKAVLNHGVRRVLLIGGDQQEAGPYPDSAALLGSGLLGEAGLDEVDVAGYPDGHPLIPEDILWSDLQLKRELAAQQGLKLSLVTQFSFSPAGIAEWCCKVAGRAPGTPVYAGIAGPTSPRQLLRYARICGVSTSLKAVNTLGLNAVKLAVHARPERQLAVLARQWAGGQAGALAGLHVFSFGGFVESAAWIDRQLRASGIQTR